MLERAEADLRNADHFVGRVRTTIRRSGVSTASEYAMREAYSMQAAASGTPHLICTTFVTNLILSGNCNTGQTLDVQLD